MKRCIIAFIFLFLVGCQADRSVDLKWLYAYLGEKADIPVLVEINKEALEEIYDLDMEDIKQFAVYRPLTNVESTEIILLQAHNEKLLDVKNAIDDYLHVTELYWENHLPSQYELVKNRIEVMVEDYYCVVIAENADEIAKVIEEKLQA